MTEVYPFDNFDAFDYMKAHLAKYAKLKDALMDRYNVDATDKTAVKKWLFEYDIGIRMLPHWYTTSNTKNQVLGMVPVVLDVLIKWGKREGIVEDE